MGDYRVMELHLSHSSGVSFGSVLTVDFLYLINCCPKFLKFGFDFFWIITVTSNPELMVPW